jgi:hypothetical protein
MANTLKNDVVLGSSSIEVIYSNDFLQTHISSH